jgi:hypothetical protein
MSGGRVLTEDLIHQKVRMPLSEIKQLNFCGIGLTDVSIVAQLPNLESVALSVNLISSLSPFSQCHNLTELYLRHNQISDFSELYHLAELPRLRTLWLTQNPIAEDYNYQEQVMAILPNLVSLDVPHVPEVERRPMTAQRPARVANPSFPELPTEPVKQRAAPIVKAPIKQPPAVVQAEPKGRRGSDQPVLKAVLSLLPSLTPESLAVVKQSLDDLGRM